MFNLDTVWSEWSPGSDSVGGWLGLRACMDPSKKKMRISAPSWKWNMIPAKYSNYLVSNSWYILYPNFIFWKKCLSLKPLSYYICSIWLTGHEGTQPTRTVSACSHGDNHVYDSLLGSGRRVFLQSCNNFSEECLASIYYPCLLILLQSALQRLWVLACSTIVEYSQQEGFYSQRHVKPPTWRTSD